MSEYLFWTEDGRPVPAVTAEQMREVDRIAVEDFGLGILQMMENAGRNLAQNAIDMLGATKGEVTVLAGAGGNGGGGLCCARHLRMPLERGVYAAVPGPNLETKAEYRYLRSIGADAVGMSTVPEVIMARFLKIRVLGISIITDMGVADALKPIGATQITTNARKAEPKLTRLVGSIIKDL